jgi:hypothetical protein
MTMGGDHEYLSRTHIMLEHSKTADSRIRQEFALLISKRNFAESDLLSVSDDRYRSVDSSRFIRSVLICVAGKIPLGPTGVLVE